MSFEDSIDPEKELQRLQSLREDKNPRRKRKSKQENPPQTKMTLKGILGSKHMMASVEDKQKFNELYAIFYKQLQEQKGEDGIKPSDELLLHQLCYATIRSGWKARLESDFGRFMDRIASHDPTTQITNLLKALGLNSTKEKDSGSTAADALMKVLSEESTSSGSTHLGYAEWQALQNKNGSEAISIRRSKEFDESVLAEEESNV